ncbi:hypothetical protein BsWGS_16958 [Bradybaena similaris]
MACSKWFLKDRPEKSRECTEVEPPSSDKCVKSKQVFGLDEQNFKPFLCSKSIALVMFYEPDNPGFEFSRMHFKKAAETTTRNNHAYAAVNCHTAPEVCCSEDVKRVPHFKLYARGRLVGFNDNARLFTSKDMKNWVELGVKGKRL